MDAELQQLTVKLAETAVRNSAGAVADRIGAARARKKDQETIVELEEIVNELIADKSELVRIAQAYEQEMVAQRISASDVEYITANIVPVITQLMESTTDDEGQESVQEMVNLIRPILSVETVTVLQLIGFNFRRAIGEPLTELVSRLILSRTSPDPSLTLELQKLIVQRELAYVEVAKDPAAHSRLTAALGQ